MTYKTKLWIARTTQRLQARFCDLTAAGIELREGLVKQHTPGKSFADIGSMWRVNGVYSFLAEECGATRIVSVDLYQTDKFLNELISRDSRVEFICGDVLLPEVARQIGVCNVVFCSGVLYHVPDPMNLLFQLRQMCDETLILCTALVPEVPGIANMAVFYPLLDQHQRGHWAHYRGLRQLSITVPYEAEAGYANNFWGLTPSCVESMLKCAGFEVVERHLDLFRGCFVCQAKGGGNDLESGR